MINETIDNGETEVQVATIGTVIGSTPEGDPIEQNFSETFNCDDETKELVYALQKLPLKYSCVITFYYYEGYKIAEIAKILGCSQNTVKSRLRRGRKYLADIMHDAEELL